MLQKIKWDSGEYQSFVQSPHHSTAQGRITTSISFRCFSSDSESKETKLDPPQRYSGSCVKHLSWFQTLSSQVFHKPPPAVPVKVSEMLLDIKVARNMVECALTPDSGALHPI